jgi:hypothetical protein
MQVFDLQFTDAASLQEAFRRTQDLPAITSCTLESAALRMRFLAPRQAAEALTQRIYLDGGLRWCSGHELRS